MRKAPRPLRLLPLAFVVLGALLLLWRLQPPADHHDQRPAALAAPRLAPAPPAQAPAIASPPRRASPETATDPQPGQLRVRILDTQGAPRPDGWALPLSCPHFRPATGITDLEPLELAYRAAPGPCELVAARMDGMVRVEGTPVRVIVPEGGVIHVDLTLPSHTVGALYAAIAPDDLGARLRWIPPDGPLDRAGLAPGDVVVAIDSMPLAGLDPLDMLRAMQGPEGETVILEVIPASTAPNDTGDPTVRVQVAFEVFQGLEEGL